LGISHILVSFRDHLLSKEIGIAASFSVGDIHIHWKFVECRLTDI